MFQKSTLDFLKKLKRNNNREWFNSNKQLYLDAKYDFEIFVAQLIERISEFDETVSGLLPKDCVFRIYKDVRFSKDKSPYKTNFGATINRGGRKMNTAGYYFHIAPGECMLAGGRYMPSPEDLLVIRNHIAANYREYNRIISHKDYKKYFGGVWGEKLKTAPKGFPKDHPAIEHLKLKSFIAYHNFPDEKLFAKNLLDYSGKVFKAMKPFLDFLRAAE
jgi:uncharacterized protein (TIGR02453 family)